jgi:hypothetical protein
MGYNWDDYKSAGNYVKFDDPGDKVVGDIISIRTGTDYNGNPCPELLLRDDEGEEHTLSAGQALLKSALAEQAPQVGDKLFVQYTGEQQLTNGRTAKAFKVAVQTGAGNVEPEVIQRQDMRDMQAQAAAAKAGGPVPTDEIPF